MLMIEIILHHLYKNPIKSKLIKDRCKLKIISDKGNECLDYSKTCVSYSFQMQILVIHSTENIITYDN